MIQRYNGSTYIGAWEGDWKSLLNSLTAVQTYSLLTFSALQATLGMPNGSSRWVIVFWRMSSNTGAAMAVPIGTGGKVYRAALLSDVWTDWIEV